MTRKKKGGAGAQQQQQQQQQQQTADVSVVVAPTTATPSTTNASNNNNNNNPQAKGKGIPAKPAGRGTTPASAPGAGMVLGGPPPSNNATNNPAASNAEGGAGGAKKKKKKKNKAAKATEGNKNQSTAEKDDDSDILEIVTPGVQRTEGAKTENNNSNAPSGKNSNFEWTFQPEDSAKDNAKDNAKATLEKLPKAVQTRVKALKKLNTSYSELRKQFDKELHELEQKYEALYNPLFVKRSDIVQGNYEPSADDLPDDEKSSHALPDSDPKGIPEFWLQAMKNQETLALLITPDDEKVLGYMKDLKCNNKDQEFELQFHFNDNPFFTDSVLTKTYKFSEEAEGLEDDEELCTGIEGCDIHWKPGKNLTVKVEKKKQKKKGKPVRTVTQEVSNESFFNFFKAPAVPNPADMDMDDEDEEDFDMHQEAQAEFEMDLDIASLIKERLIPHALGFFTGELTSHHDSHGHDFDFDDADEDEDEDDDDDDAGSPPPLVKSGGKRKGTPASGGEHKAPAANVEQPPECKQQ
jgi:nucleosome assembly protein 1-like 1